MLYYIIKYFNTCQWKMVILVKKYRKIINLLIFAAFLGFFFAFLKHEGHWIKLTNGLKSIGWYLYPLILIFIIFKAILIHELGHLFSFLLNGIRIKALYVLIFVLMKNENNKWRLKVFPKYIKFLGGLVVPKLPSIRSEEEIKEIRKSFSKALIAGPNTSIYYFIIITILFLVFLLFTNLNTLIALLFLNFIITGFLTVLVVLSSKVHTTEMYGDYVAYSKFLEDDKFALVQILQYLSFSSLKTKESDQFFYMFLTKYYETNRLSYNMLDLMLSTYFLNFFIDSNDTINNSVDKTIKYYNVKRLASSKYGRELAYLVAASFYKKRDSKNAYEYFKIINETKNNNLEEEQIELLEKEYEHLLNLNDNSNYFISKKKYIKNNLFVFEPILNVDEMINDMNKQLRFVEYKTNLYCPIDK